MFKSQGAQRMCLTHAHFREAIHSKRQKRRVALHTQPTGPDPCGLCHWMRSTSQWRRRRYEIHARLHCEEAPGALILRGIHGVETRLQVRRIFVIL